MIKLGRTKDVRSVIDIPKYNQVKMSYQKGAIKIELFSVLESHNFNTYEIGTTLILNLLLSYIR